MSVLLETIVDETGFSVGASLFVANTLFLVSAGFAGTAVGELIARHDARITVVIGTLVMALIFGCCQWLGTLPEIYRFPAALGVGYAMTSLVPATTLTARWLSNAAPWRLL